MCTLRICSQNVHVGDTLTWYVRRIGDGKVFPMQFEMGWSSLMRNQSSGPFIQNGASTAARILTGAPLEPSKRRVA
jgi:hypothetical protein